MLLGHYVEQHITNSTLNDFGATYDFDPPHTIHIHCC
ncbi:hypothetical protein FX988_02665 [Paraglaciecola mesophila]|uniref:Uncharacterized protein n=1 Tax=Paraglaciecola mesophila TaxID=197222 RepID=A0A857JM75_9ALTE|nr:hypothetical protein FX988_02665 [Paraglaciecola mesophila]